MCAYVVNGCTSNPELLVLDVLESIMDPQFFLLIKQTTVHTAKQQKETNKHTLTQLVIAIRVKH